MSGPVLTWNADDVSVAFEGISVDPVTAWTILSQQAQSETWRKETVFSILDAEDPGAVLQPREDKKPNSLQTLVAPPEILAADLNAGLLDKIWERNKIASPRLYALPLHGRSLPEDLANNSNFGTEFIVLENSGPLPLPPDKIGDTPPDIIVGIIDYAINPTHARFQHVGADGKRQSRIAHFWLQDGGHAAPEVPVGFEFNGAAINEALVAAQGDEEAALRRLGLLHFGKDPTDTPKSELARRLSHGTHVLDLAAGRDPFDPDGMRVQIVAVALPDEVRRDTSGKSLSLFFLHGLEYILLRCRDIHKKHCDKHDGKVPPILICASLGITGGPRNGRHLIERGADALLAQHGDLIGETGKASLYLPSGNSNLVRGHAVSAPDGSAAELNVPWRLQPGDETPNHLEAWIAYPPDNPPDKVTLTLTPPGTWAPPGPLELTPGQARLLTRGPAGGVGAGMIGRAMLEKSPEGPLQLSITLSATDPAATGLPAAPAGAWGVEIAAPATEISAWILRDDDPVGHSGNVRQSYFDALDYVERDRRGALESTDPDPPGSAVRRAGTLNAIATSAERDVVGGFIQPLQVASGETPVSAAVRYAGTPLPDGRALAQEERVAWAAPCDSSPVLRGVLAAGTRSGSLVAMDGTSVAAPQVIRAQVDLHLDLSEDEPPTLPPPPGKEHPVPLGKRPIRTPLAVNRLDARAGEGEPRV